jgi:hypothetical protein
MQHIMKRMYSLEEVMVTRDSLPYVVHALLEDEVVKKLTIEPYQGIILEDYLPMVTSLLRTNRGIENISLARVMVVGKLPEVFARYQEDLAAALAANKTLKTVEITRLDWGFPSSTPEQFIEV